MPSRGKTEAARRALPLLTALCVSLCAEIGTVGPAYAEPAPVATVVNGSTAILCAPGTTDLGVHDGYQRLAKIPVRLCAVDNLASKAPESNPTTSYYIKNGTVGANRHAIVNSRVSGAVQAMVRDMKAAGLSVSALSAYRSMGRQQALCTEDARCRRGDYRLLARPGTSNHQMGLAIDFTMQRVNVPGAGCAKPASAPKDPVWRWLTAHAAQYGFKQYAAESWHWGSRKGGGGC